MKTNFKILIVLLSLVLPMLVHSAQVSLIASDASGNTSMNSVGKWGPDSTGHAALAPQPTNDYFTGPFFFRTPPNGAGITFAGHSVTLQDVTGNPGSGGQGTPFRSILYKGTGGDTITINNLTNAAGGVLNNGGSGAVAPPIFTGNLWYIAGNSTVLSDQGSTTIGYPLGGSATLTNTSGGTRTITYTENLSAFTGKFYITSTCTVALNFNNLGNPAVFTPDQITIGAGCVLLDNVGITFNNANGGITLAGNATINAAAATVIAEPITDNGSNFVLTTTGAGTIKISTPSTYSGGTTISGGVLQIGVPNALTNIGSVTANATLDLNAISTTINGLNGAGTVDTFAGGTPTLTVGANGGNGTLTGTINNSAGTLSLTKVGAGTETLSGGYTYSGDTVVAGGTLSLVTSAALPPTPGNLTISNGATLTMNASSSIPLPVNNLVFGLGSATNNFNYGTLTANPTVPVINAAGGISAPAASVVINITATGLQPGPAFPLIQYTGTAPANLANFSVNPPPGVGATLVNDTANHSIDLLISSTPNSLTWSGVNGASWDLTTSNWLNALSALTVFQQYTNGGVVAGDSVTFDDTLQNPGSTNITLNSIFFAFPFAVNSSLPYSIAGTGGITGVTSLALSGSGTLTLLTSNSFSGGVNIANTSLIITNDSALGVSNGLVTFNGGSLQFNGSTTNNARNFTMPVLATIGVSTNNVVRLGGRITGAGASFNRTDNGTLVLAGRNTFTGDMFLHSGFTVIDSGGSLTNTVFDDVGQNTTDAATLTIQGTGSLGTANDFNLGDLDSSIGTLNMTGSATLTVNQFFVGSANAAGSTATGIVNQVSGTVTEVSTAVGAFAIGGRTSTLGVGIYNMNGGTVTANAGVRVGGTGIGTLNMNGGTFNAIGGINVARQPGSIGTNNLNGGTLATLNLTSSTGTNAVANFNGGTLLAAFNPATPWVNNLASANILAGGAIIDSSNFSVTITQPLLAGSANGGLTKKGSGTLTLSGVNTFTGPITNNAGILSLNSASTYPGAMAVNAGTVQMTTTSVIQGGTTVASNAVLSIVQLGSATMTLGDLTFNGVATGSLPTLGLTPNTANNPNVALVNCGTLTLNGTNTVSLAAVNIGTLALVKYGALAGSGNITNLALPQGATGFISNSATASTLYAVITSTGPGLVWTGTNSVSPNLWDIGTTANWLVNSTSTTYHQIITPGDAVTFTDSGSGTVILNTTVAPASMVISNSSLTYTFKGSGSISGSTGLQKLGTGTAIVNLTNNTYTGNTAISNGTLQLGISNAISSAANLVVGFGGTLELAGVSPTVGELTGSGIIDNASGINPTLTVGTSSGGTWNGTIKDHGAGGVTLHKVGSGTWFVGGTNFLNDGQPFTDQTLISAGTVIVTNGGLLSVDNLQLRIGDTAGQAASVVVAGGTLAVSNNVLSVGYGSATASGTLTINNGTVFHAGTTAGAGFAALPNSIDVGAQGATGTLIVNGGQILNNLPLYLGDGTGANGTLQLNGGLVQASQVLANGTPTTSVANFNGGTLQATTNSTSFLQVVSMVMSNGLVLDDGGFTLSIGATSLQSPGDGSNGGLVKKGSGTVYLDVGNSYTGTTVVTNGTLAGIGNVTGSLSVGPAGNLGAGDAGGIGTFAIGGNLTLQGNATFRIDKSGGFVLQPDQITVTSNATYGGILTVSNITSDGITLLTNGDTFQLFSVSGTPSGSFTSIAGSPGTGFAYQFNPASGVLSVVTSTIATNPTNITFSVSGGVLSLVWPMDHLGWILQLQTNSLSTGISTNWVDVAGSAGVTSTNMTINPQTPTEFFRLRKP